MKNRILPLSEFGNRLTKLADKGQDSHEAMHGTFPMGRRRRALLSQLGWRLAPPL